MYPTQPTNPSHHPIKPARDCWTVAFGNSYSDEDRCVVAGYDNGDVKIFDLRTSTMRYETNVGNGVTSVEFDRKDIEMNKMSVTTLESRFRVLDMRTQVSELGCDGAVCCCVVLCVVLCVECCVLCAVCCMLCAVCSPPPSLSLPLSLSPSQHPTAGVAYLTEKAHVATGKKSRVE